MSNLLAEKTVGEGNMEDFIEVIEDGQSTGTFQGADFINNLPYIFKDDVLFDIIRKSHREMEIMTPSLTSLQEGRLYSTPEVGELLHLPTSTVRGWIIELNQYIGVTEQGRYLKCDYKAVFKLRMVQFLRTNNEYTMTKLKELVLGEVTTNDEKEENIPLNEKVEKLTQHVMELEERYQNTLEKQTFILSNLLDPEALKSGDFKINPNIITPLLDNSKKIEDDIHKKYDRLDEAINGKVDEKYIKEELAKLQPEKIEELIRQVLDQETKNKTFWQKLKMLFGK